MSKKRQVYIHEVLPDQINDLLVGSNVPLVKNETEKSSSLYRHGGDSGNIFFKPINWNKINQSPLAFINRQLTDWDIPRLILKRFFAGEGELGPEENYKGILQKSGTLKVLDTNSLGYFSDVITSFAVDSKVNPTQLRNFSVMILSYLEFLNREDLINLPLEVDYGISQDGFFLQIHCDKNNFFLENILESVAEPELKNPFVSLLRESIAKVDLLEIYTLEASNKLVLNACWITNPNFTRTDFFPSLVIHQVKHLRGDNKGFGSSVAPTTFYDPELKDFRKAKVAEKLPGKYGEQKTLKEAINPVLVKRLYNFITDSHSRSGYSVQESGYSLDVLSKDVEKFPDKEALGRLNSSEREELVRIILENAPEFISQVEEVKSQIESEDYLEGILNSLDSMTYEEAELVLGDSDSSDDSETISGEKEDIGEESQLVKGQREDLTEESETVKGYDEDFGDESEKINGEFEDLGEESQLIEGTKEDLTPEKLVVRGTKEKEENWKVKKGNVQEKIKGIINDRRLEGATHEEIDKEVKTLIKSELNLSEEKSEKLISNISDAASDEWLKGGVDAVNENIKQRIRIEKMENQLSLREKQVEKMKALIGSLKNEIGGVRKELQIAKGSVLSNAEASVGEIENSNYPAVESSDRESQQKIISNQAAKISDLREEAEGARKEKDQLEQNYKTEINNLKAKSAEDDRELQKLRNEVHKLGDEKELLHKKVRESVEEVAEIRDSDEDTSAVLKENETLKAQVESLKKRMSFMYENSKSNKDIEIGANEVQKIIEDKERFFEDKLRLTKELDSVKADLRESERLIKQRDLELKEKSDMLKGRPVGEDQDEVMKLKKEMDEFKQAGSKLQTELKASQLKTKSLEQKIKFMTAQLDKYYAASRQKAGVGGSMGSADPKAAIKLKQVETMNKRLKEAGDKASKELIEKKAELHKMKMENKTLELKVRELEKKLGKNAA